ncbi:ABC transporter ATP-binding protein [Paludisphaera borealis]|uniref:Lipoprotein-releasing system ATP-binding protein LolD n=1 Tax=Paludisphaera borealis TaxID=1387353 RepID=A0A1U7CJA6_9BACT|nr:ABC transporter ATP-binding protein [Paludisphaera borealis]APW58963.1 Lipoprotein-releasing system ATP-binding protein LolD [Paludisphaera borealis]
MSDPHDHTDAPVLRGERLSKLYPDGEVAALRGVSLQVAAGESVAVVGPSGCGKTTLLHLLGGLDRPTEGEVFFRGTPLAKLDGDQYRAREIGFVFQSFHLLTTLSAVENIQIPMFETPWTPRERASRAEELIKQVGMAHRRNHRPTRLSVGERQRIAIARALANEPSVLLADEPTGNLDSRNQDEILRLLEDLRRSRGLTLVTVTHSAEVAAAAGRVVRMRDGLVVET